MFASRTLGRAAALATFVGTALTATAGDFNVLAMNVAGLPAILQGNGVPGDKAVNSRIIGSKFAQYGYDIIHAQEGRVLHPSA
jgi:hypothetical protein